MQMLICIILKCLISFSEAAFTLKCICYKVYAGSVSAVATCIKIGL